MLTVIPLLLACQPDPALKTGRRELPEAVEGDTGAGAVPSDTGSPTASDPGGPYQGPVGELLILEAGEVSGSARYSWSLEVPEASALGADALLGADTASPAFVPDVAGTYIAELVVFIEGVGDLSPGHAVVDIYDPDTPWSPVEYSEYSYCAVGQEHTLDGHLEDASTTKWSLWSVPAASALTEADLDGIDAPELSFTADVPGSYILSVSWLVDGEWLAPYVRTLTFADPEDNAAPAASAGADDLIEVEAACDRDGSGWSCEPCAAQEIVLDGTGSHDPDGDLLSYAWSEPTGALAISAPGAALSVATTPSVAATYKAEVTEAWSVTLEASDCLGSSSHTIEIEVVCRGAAR